MKLRSAALAALAMLVPAVVAQAQPTVDARPPADPSASTSSSAPPSAASAPALPSASTAPALSAASPPPVAGPPSPRRAKPDYDGRGPAPSTVGDGLLWAPRVLFFPLYVVSEYVLRRPIGAFVYAADTKHWAIQVLDFFTFGPDRQIGVFPTGFVDFGLNPSVGLFGYYNRLFAPENSAHFQVGFWGPKWLSFGLTDRIALNGPKDPDSFVSLGATWTRRPDHPFYGLGPRSLHRDESRYGAAVLDVPLLYQRKTGIFTLKSAVGGRIARFHHGECCDDVDLAVYANEGRYPLPPGYPDGYDAVYSRLEGIVDSRPRRPANQTGVRVDAYVEGGVDPRDDASWVKYGGSVGGYVDVGKQRAIGLTATALFVDPGKGVTPFRELVNLGGYGLMRGYLEYRLIDRSAAVLDLEYRWPVWVFLDGTLQASLGNVFGAHLSGFTADLLRMSAAIGVKSNNSADHQFEALFGLGSETFAQGFDISSVRLYVGGTTAVFLGSRRSRCPPHAALRVSRA